MAQDWSVHALVYFCSAVDDLLGAVLHRHLDMELADMKTIIEMAREAGWQQDMFGFGIWDSKELNVFAALVRADEREACAKVCDARALEYDGFSAEQNASEKLAAAIRARGQA